MRAPQFCVSYGGCCPATAGGLFLLCPYCDTPRRHVYQKGLIPIRSFTARGVVACYPSISLLSVPRRGQGEVEFSHGCQFRWHFCYHDLQMDSGALRDSRFPPFMVKVPAVISVIIAVYNDWDRIGGCLKSLSEQTNVPPFEVVIVDDGSLTGAPDQVLDWSSSYPIKFIRQSHAGVAVARNRGLQVAAGAIFVFVDCDCVLRPDCLTLLMSAVALSPQDGYFQLRLVGDYSDLVGRAEHLHLSTVQQRFLLNDGLHIRFLDTAGVAVRSEFVQKSRGLFDARAIRAQDTFLLSELIRAGHMPRFVPDAVVLHAVNLTLREYLLKALKSGYLEGKTYGMIASRGMTIRVTNFQRVSMLASLWINSRQSSAGLLAFFIVSLRQILKLLGSAAYRCFHLSPDPKVFCSGLDDASLQAEHDNQ